MVTIMNKVFLGRIGKGVLTVLAASSLAGASVHSTNANPINTLAQAKVEKEGDHLEGGVEKAFGIEEVVLSEIDAETYETTIIKMDETYKQQSAPVIEEVTKKEENQNEDIVIYEEVLEMIPKEKQIPSDGTFISAFGPSNKYIYSATEEEILLLAQIIWAEAGDQNLEGKVLVGAVVLNRLSEGRFGSSITEVVTAKGQFASISDAEPKQDCIEAARMALQGWDPSRVVFEDGALYFHTPKAHVQNRKNVVLKLQIGGHYCTREYGK